MPTVPRYERPLVRQENFPGVRENIDADISAFGGGKATQQAFGAIGEAAGLASQIAQKEKDRVDNLSADAAIYKTISEKNRLRDDPKSGYMTRKGKDAMSAISEYQENWKKFSDEITEKELTNDNQKRIYASKLAPLSLEFTNQLDRYAAHERQAYEEEQTKVGMAVLHDDAVNNYQIPGKVQQSVEARKNIIKSFAEANGKSKEWVDDTTKNEVSKTHRDVITRMFNTDQDIAANKYLESVKAKGEISSDDLLSLEKTAQEGSLRGESQRIVDKIMDKDLDRLEAYEEARKVKDPKLRQAVEQRITDEYQRQKAAEAEARDDLYMRSTNMVDSSPGRKPREVIPASDWSRLSLDQRNALERRADNPENDDKAWLDFLDLDPNTMVKMDRSTFETKYWSRFDESHKTRAEAYWKNIKGEGDAAHLSSTLTFNDMVDNALRTNALINPTKEKAKFSKHEVKLYADFEKNAARQIEDFERTELGGKRKSTTVEKQKIIDGLLDKRVFIDKAWARDPEMPAALVSEGDRPYVYVPIESVPDADRRWIENTLKSKGKKVSDRKVEKAYGARVMGDKEAFFRILEE